MKLNTLILAGLLMAGCSNQSQLFYISGFPILDGQCVPGDVRSTGGFLDVAAGAPRFLIGANITGALEVKQAPVTLGGTTLEGANRDRPIVQSMVVNYRLSKRVGATPKPYTMLLSSPFDESGSLKLVVQLISPDLGQALFDGLQPSTSAMEDFVDVSCDVEFKGEFSNSKTPFSTGVLTFPIRAYRSSPTATCAKGFAPFVEDGTSGNVNFCRYVGQSATISEMPPTPVTCCGDTMVKTGGC